MDLFIFMENFSQFVWVKGMVLEELLHFTIKFVFNTFGENHNHISEVLQLETLITSSFPAARFIFLSSSFARFLFLI